MPALEHPPQLAQRAAARLVSELLAVWVYAQRGWGRILWSLMIFFRCLKFKFFSCFFLALFFSLSLTLTRARKDSLLFFHFSYTQHSLDAVNSPRLTLPPPSDRCHPLVLVWYSPWFESDVTAFRVDDCRGMDLMSSFTSSRKSTADTAEELQIDESLSCSVTCNRRQLSSPPTTHSTKNHKTTALLRRLCWKTQKSIRNALMFWRF